MKCLTVRQPWAWLIIHAGKDIENRTWATRYRGPLAIHAGKARPSRAEYDWVAEYAAEQGITLPSLPDLSLGGIIGTVTLADCIKASDSPWWQGPVGWLLQDPAPTPFRPVHGQLGLFDVEL